MVAEGYAWRQYMVITDERCVIVEMLPALFGGWKVHRVTVQGSEDWPRYKRDAIVAFRLGQHNGPVMAPELGVFRDKLLAVAAAGHLPEHT